MKRKMISDKIKGAVILLAACLATGMFALPLQAAEETAEKSAEPIVETEADAAAEPAADEAKDTLRVGVTTPFDGKFFTDMWGNSVSDLDVCFLLHGYNLVEWRTDEGRFRVDPSVVSGIKVTDNAQGDRTYTLSLYSDLCYSSSEPITAKDYAFSILLSIAPQIREIGGTPRNMEYLAGYRDYVEGRTDTLKGLRILNDQTISFTVSHEYLPFFYELAMLDCIPYPISEIAPGCMVEDTGNGVRIVNDPELTDASEEPRFTAELLADSILDEESGYLTYPMVTSGPYKLVSFDGQTVQLQKNMYYKGNSDGAKPAIENLIYSTAKNETMIDDLQAGTFDLLNKCMEQNALQKGFDLVQNGNGYQSASYDRSGMAFISFCCEQPALQSAAVRQAIAHCLDKDALVEGYVGEYGKRVDGYYGIGQWMYKLLDGTIPYPIRKSEGETAPDNSEEQKAWESLNLDGVIIYDLDVDEAVRMLEGDGWVLNTDGEAFDPETDEVRCKELNGQLTALELTLIYPEGNEVGEYLQEAFADNLAQAGVILHLEPKPQQDLLREYYRQNGSRSCDMIYLATNFDIVYDPSQTFRPEEAEDTSANSRNTTGYSDEELYRLAADMKQTKPGDTLSYCRKWIAFEEYFSQVLPMIPIYSNTYYDFYTGDLQNYQISQYVSWGQAILPAYIAEN